MLIKKKEEETESMGQIVYNNGEPVLAEFIKADMVSEDTVVIDVGVNRVDDPTSDKGYKLVGDVAFDEVKEKVKAICNKDIEYRKTGEGTWIYDALEFDRDTREVIAKEGFKNSHWYKFQLAAKTQLSTVVEMVKDMKW